MSPFYVYCLLLCLLLLFLHTFVVFINKIIVIVILFITKITVQCFSSGQRFICDFTFISRNVLFLPEMRQNAFTDRTLTELAGEL